MSAPAATKARRILLVDDDISLLITLGDFLRYEGYDVTTAESGERALEILRTLRPDLIVLDMSMPGMGGRGFLERITEPSGKVRFPVLVLTARATMAEFFARTQVDGFIAKPCDPSDLLLEIGRIIFLRSGDLGDAETAPPLSSQARALIGESDKPINDRLRAALEKAGFEVESVFLGPDVLEAVIVGKPQIIILRLELEGMSADAILAVLEQIPNTAGIPAVVYGIDTPGVKLEHVEALDDKKARLIGGTASGPIVAAARAAVNTA